MVVALLAIGLAFSVTSISAATSGDGGKHAKHRTRRAATSSASTSKAAKATAKAKARATAKAKTTAKAKAKAKAKANAKAKAKAKAHRKATTQPPRATADSSKSAKSGAKASKPAGTKRPKRQPSPASAPTAASPAASGPAISTVNAPTANAFGLAPSPTAPAPSGATFAPPLTSAPASATAGTPAATPAPAGAAAPAAGTIGSATVNSLLSNTRLVSYYPAGAGWWSMWTAWNPTQVDADFGRLQSLGFNTVRIIVLPFAFDFPNPQPLMLSRLSEAVGLAAKHGLRVQLTLFDGFHNWSNIAGSKTWLESVLGPYASDSRIAFVELRNELDPTDPAAVSWASQLLPYAHSIAPALPMTISTSDEGDGIAAIKQIKDELGPALDFLDFHYYGKAARATTVFKKAQAIAAGMPLYVGETGYSTDPSQALIPGLPAGTASQEAYQDLYFRTIAAAAKRVGLPTPALWVYSDFTPTGIPGGDASPQYHFGLFRTDGTPKPVTASITTDLIGGKIFCSFNNGFETGVENGLPADWQVEFGNLAQFARDTSVAHTGTASARIRDSAASGASQPAFLITPPSAVIPGDSYRLTAWAQGASAGGTNRINLSWVDDNENWLSTASSQQLPVGNVPWTQLMLQAVAPPGAAYVEIRLESKQNAGTVWFDDVSFDPTNGTPADPGCS